MKRRQKRPNVVPWIVQFILAWLLIAIDSPIPGLNLPLPLRLGIIYCGILALLLIKVRRREPEE
jgi:hypothetical protein